MQGGTELRRKSVVLMVSFNGEVLPILCNDTTDFDHVLKRVSEKWNLLCISDISFNYHIGEYRNCQLAGEDDFFAMQLLVDQFAVTRVDVELLCGRGNTGSAKGVPLSSHVGLDSVDECKGSGSKEGNNSGSKEGNSSESKGDYNGETEDFPFYDACPPIGTTSRQSDHWAYNIRNVGQRFLGGAKEFREELSKFATIKGFKYYFTKNTRLGVSVYCAKRDISGCKWKISGTCKTWDPAFTINHAVLEHDCTEFIVTDKDTRLTPKVMGGMVIADVQGNPQLTGKDVQKYLSKEFGLNLGYSKAWRTLQAAREQVYGAYNESFEQLRWYGDAIVETNPGSVVELKADPDTKQFHRFFLALNACLEGFAHCRPMIFIEATSLKGKFKGQLLSATGKDGNNGLFPIAIAIVDAETVDHWTWFISKLKDVVRHEKKVCYLSDRHIGILTAFAKVFEEPVHYFCLFHLYTNLKGMYRGGWSNPFKRKMVHLFKVAAYAPTKPLFDEAFQNFIDAGGPQALAFLEDLPYEKWALAWSSDQSRYDEMTSNAAESYNKWIKPIRALPVCSLVDTIRQQIMIWYTERRSDCETWTSALTPYKEQFWNAACQQGRGWKIIKAPREGVFEVISKTTASVNLVDKTCSCFQWQVQGFPCVHAVNVIASNLPTIEGHVDPHFFTSTYRQAYAADLNPVPGSVKFDCTRKLGVTDSILPPTAKAAIERPKRKRISSSGENSSEAGEEVQISSLSSGGEEA